VVLAERDYDSGIRALDALAQKELQAGRRLPGLYQKLRRAR
jgi:hypothetical protein